MATTGSRIKPQNISSEESVFESTPGTPDEVRARYERQTGSRTTAYIWAVVILAVAGFIAYSVYFAPANGPAVTDQSTQTQTQMAPATPQATVPDNSATNPPATNSAPPADNNANAPATNVAPATPPADTAPATPPATNSTSP